MQVKLMRLTLQNFKGIANFTLEPQGEDCLIRGINGTGKTTLFDAFLYLLFGKDSRGRSDFQIKTLDENGQEIPGLDHSVEAVLDVDGKQATLKKLYKEKWTKKRGSAHNTLTGHTVDHYIDGVPVKQKEWQQKISELVEEETFKLLTSPFYFNSLHWEKRRNLLLEICGDIADNDVIQSNPDLEQLNEILSNKSIEDHKKVVASRKKEINNRLNEIPARIDELQNSINNVADLDRSAINTRIKDLQEQIENARSGSQVATLRKQKADLQADLAEKRNQQHQEIQVKENEVREEKGDKPLDLQELHRKYKEHEQEIANAQKWIQKCDNEMERLRQLYFQKQKEQPEIKEVCPTCGQNLPQDQVQQAQDNFNANKAEELKQINETGKAWQKEKEEAQEKANNSNNSLGSLSGQIEQAQKEIENLDQQLKDIRANATTSVDQKITELESQIQELHQQIQNSEGEVDTTELQRQLDTERSNLSRLDAAEDSRKRIEELKGEEKQLSQEYEKLEQETYLMEQFTVQKVNMLEGKINNKFELARFKLFEEQINEGIKETAETTYDGVPYNSLNNGARINVGLDIIKTLSKYYGIQTVLFIDNAESIVNLLNIDSQMINLVVDGHYKELSVEPGLKEAVA